MLIESARVHVYAARWRIRFSRAKRANIHRLAPSPWSWCAPGGGGARGVRRQAVHPTVLRRSREPPPQRRVERSTGRHRARAKCVSVSWAKCDRVWCLCVCAPDALHPRVLRNRACCLCCALTWSACAFILWVRYSYLPAPTPSTAQRRAVCPPSVHSPNEHAALVARPCLHGNKVSPACAGPLHAPVPNCLRRLRLMGAGPCLPPNRPRPPSAMALPPALPGIDTNFALALGGPATVLCPLHATVGPAVHDDLGKTSRLPCVSFQAAQRPPPPSSPNRRLVSVRRRQIRAPRIVSRSLVALLSPTHRCPLLPRPRLWRQAYGTKTVSGSCRACACARACVDACLSAACLRACLRVCVLACVRRACLPVV